MKLPFTIIAVLGAATGLCAQQLPLQFIENQGQYLTPARFVARHSAFLARFEDRAILLQREAEVGVMLRIALAGANPDLRVAGERQSGARHNFLTGSTKQHRRTVPAYESIIYRGAWPGIDLRVRVLEGELEYDLLLAPKADPGLIRLRCEGGSGPRLTSDGGLVLATAAGDMVQKPPQTFALGFRGQAIEIASRFRIHGATEFGFEVDRPDLTTPIVIDPGLTWGTYFGATAADSANAIAKGSNGLVTVAGSTASRTLFPTTPSPTISRSSAPGRLSCAGTATGTGGAMGSR